MPPKASYVLRPSGFPSDCSRVKKQAFSPVWQVGPTGSALTRTVSPSQSTKRSFKISLWPEVSPFSQSLFRDLLQKCTDFVSSVFLRDSLFMYPSIKTEPSRQSWTIAGIRPCSSNFIPLKSVISFLSGYRREARGYRFDSPFSSIAHSLLPLALCKSHRDSTLAQIGFRLGNRVGSIVEDGGGQHRVGLAFHESLIQVLERPDAA